MRSIARLQLRIGTVELCWDQAVHCCQVQVDLGPKVTHTWQMVSPQVQSCGLLVRRSVMHFLGDMLSVLSAFHFETLQYVLHCMNKFPSY